MAIFQAAGQAPVTKLNVNSLDSGRASSLAHSFKTRAGIPSWPVALDGTSFRSAAFTAATLKWTVWVC